MDNDWEARLKAWRDELDLMARVEGTTWVPLADAEAQAGVSRSALRAWYRQGEIASRLVDGPHWPRPPPLAPARRRAARARAARPSTRRRRRTSRRGGP